VNPTNGSYYPSTPSLSTSERSEKTTHEDSSSVVDESNQREFKLQRERTRGFVERPKGESVDPSIVKIFIGITNKETLEKERELRSTPEGIFITAQQINATNTKTQTKTHCRTCTLL
jgi:hypothetical protein